MRPLRSLPSTLALSVLIAVISTAVTNANPFPQFIETQLFTGDRPTEQQFFGNRMANDGRNLAVGVWGDHLGYPHGGHGSVVFFRYEDGGWQRGQRFIGHSEAANFAYGNRIKMDGEWAVVHSGAAGGFLDILRFDGVGWRRFQTLVADNDTRIDSLYGYFDLEGNTLAVLEQDLRAINIFRFNGNVWEFEGPLPQPVPFTTAGPFNAYNYYPKVDGDRVFTVIYRRGTSQLPDGNFLHIYRRTSNGWILSQPEAPPQLVPGVTSFGSLPMDVEGEWMGIGEGRCAGQRYVSMYRLDPAIDQYRYHSSVRSHRWGVDPDAGPCPTDGFANDLDIEGTRMIVGAPQHSSVAFPRVGHGAAFTYVYDETTDAWLPEQELISAHQASLTGLDNTSFGWRVGLFEGGAIVADHHAFFDQTPTRSGTVTTFVRGFGTSTCVGTPGPNFGLPASLTAVGVAESPDPTLAFESNLGPPGAPYHLMASPQALQVALPTGGTGDICVGRPRMTPGFVGRYDASGVTRFDIDGTLESAVASTSGLTLHFQLWYRWPAGPQPTAVTNSLSVLFR